MGTLLTADPVRWTSRSFGFSPNLGCGGVVCKTSDRSVMGDGCGLSATTMAERPACGKSNEFVDEARSMCKATRWKKIETLTA